MSKIHSDILLPKNSHRWGSGRGGPGAARRRGATCWIRHGSGIGLINIHLQYAFFYDVRYYTSYTSSLGEQDGDMNKNASVKNITCANMAYVLHNWQQYINILYVIHCQTPNMDRREHANTHISKSNDLVGSCRFSPFCTLCLSFFLFLSFFCYFQKNHKWSIPSSNYDFMMLSSVQ